MRLLNLNPARILHFDIEARPLGWYGGDFTHKEPTAIAWSWADEDEVHVELLDYRGPGRMLDTFLEAYNEAGIVTGHYIRGFDLPLLNAAYVESGFDPLTAKRTSDTKGDLLRLHGISKSQENLGAWLGIPAPKVGMNMEDWRKANRLHKDGLELVKERVVGDVIQHKALRAALLDAKLLGPTKVWSPDPGNSARYTP